MKHEIYLFITKHFSPWFQNGTLRHLDGADQLEKKEDDLNTTYDRESSEESHGSTNETKLGLGLDLLVSLNVVEGRRVKEDLHQLKSWVWQLLPWDHIGY